MQSCPQPSLLRIIGALWNHEPVDHPKALAAVNAASSDVKIEVSISSHAATDVSLTSHEAHLLELLL